MKIALDTNIVAYAAGLKRASADAEKVLKSRALLAALGGDHEMIMATQVLGELFNVIVRNGVSRSEARDIATVFAAKYTVTPAVGPISMTHLHWRSIIAFRYGTL